MTRRSKTAKCACGKALYWGNKSGKCRACLNADADYHARKAEAIKWAFQCNPHYRDKHRSALAESNRRPERRVRSGQLARDLKIWERGLANVTAESRAKVAKANSERRLAHIPLAHRDEYKRLAKKLGAAEAARIIQDHANAVAERALA